METQTLNPNTNTTTPIDDRREETIKRLRGERAEHLNRSRAAGEEDGREFVFDERGDYDTIRKLVALAEVPYVLSEPWSDLWRTFEMVFDDENAAHAEMIKEHQLDENEFARGFVDGVAEAWREIEKEVEAD